MALAVAFVGFLFAAYLVILPFGDIQAGAVVAFVPVIDAVVFVGELIIAALLYGQAEIFRSRALTLLASGFVFIALLLIPHALTFPGAFAPEGLLGPGASGTAWIMILRRLAFPIAVLLYALLKTADAQARPEARPPARALVWASGAVALALATTALAIGGGDLLPPIFIDSSQANRFNLTIANLSNITVVLVAMSVLFVRRRSVLDMWLQVALAGWLIQSVLNLSIEARFTVGFYSLYVVILLSHLIVLLALIAESSRLYARLALSTVARDRERDARMMSMEAVAAVLSHEVGQPLAAVTLSARAGLNSLTRAEPDPDRAIKSLRDTIEAGNRAFDVVKSIRASFAQGSGTLSRFSLNDLVRETASLRAREFAARKVSLHLALDETLPSILANRVQIQRVLINLLTNAMEALGAPGRHVRRISIRSTALEDESVLLEISDTGAGIPSELIEHVFDPFFTTKLKGTGLGLSLSRTILEEHGGRLWVSPESVHGTTFHLLLPCDGPAARG